MQAMSEPTIRVGQHWRDDESGYIMRVVAIDTDGRIWCRHPNAKRGGHIVNPGWFKHWTMTRAA